jgi:hypothetical protein
LECTKGAGGGTEGCDERVRGDDENSDRMENDDERRGDER